MGAVVLSSEDLMEKKKDEMVKWERFLPRMALRVLLVEADDSTRQIISALLRKSSYRVTAVPDGLKAWEILKGRAHNVDIILTEVDLPSISGFALLTLIMENEICKNIPVIMMSSQDSVSTVYKCMLRGAADYLVKPVRRNELRNLWQHVWRRQSSTICGNVAQDESFGQQKIEATSENNAASNHSSGHMDCIQRNEECVEKGSDAQSSCTKPDFEAESAQKEETQEFSRQLQGKSLLNDVKMLQHEASFNYGEKMLVHESEVPGSEVDAGRDANIRANLGKNVGPESQRKDVPLINGAHNVLVNSSTEAIDFMGAYNNQNSSSNKGTSKIVTAPQLDLSLRRSHPSGFENQVTDQRFTIGHSDASAFTRYTNKPLQPAHSTSHTVFNQRKEFGLDSEKNLSNVVALSNSDTHLAMLSNTQRSISSFGTNQSKQFELETLCPQERVCPVPVPVKGMRPYTGYGSGLPHIFCAQSGLSPTPSPSSANQREPFFLVNPIHCTNVENSNSSQLYDQHGENAIKSTNHTMLKLNHQLETLEDRGHISPTTDQSATSSFCNGALSRLNSIGYGSTCGSNSNVDQVAAGRAAAESKNEDVFCPSNGNSHRSIEREAALTKFRLKRKDRCYEKKVRYESRKKLAEQRPRVKGQFVRQAHPDPAPAESENYCGNSVDG